MFQKREEWKKNHNHGRKWQLGLCKGVLIAYKGENEALLLGFFHTLL